MEGTWAVRYRDGSGLAQFDHESTHFLVAALHPRGGEVPFRAIDWAQVTDLCFTSDLATTTYSIAELSPEFYWGLRSRTFMVPQVGAELRCFMLCQFRRAVVIDPDRIGTAEAATENILYWFPDGSEHQCPHYNCADVGQWVNDMVAGRSTGLMPATHELKLVASPYLV